MRNIIIILASIYFICISAEERSSIVTQCKQSCSRIRNDFSDGNARGFIVDNKCHCMIHKGIIPDSEDLDCDIMCYKKLDYHTHGTRVFSQQGIDECVCYQYLDCTVKYCDDFCNKEYRKNPVNGHYIKGYCHEGGQCRCEYIPYEECQGNNTLQCSIKKMETLIDIYNEKQRVYREYDNVGSCHCDPTVYCHCNPIQNCYPHVNITNLQPYVPSPCESCECKCTMNDDCKSCFFCYGMGYDLCKYSYQCEKCIDCIHNCTKPINMKIGGCSVMCYTQQEDNFVPFVYNKKYEENNEN